MCNHIFLTITTSEVYVKNIPEYFLGQSVHINETFTHCLTSLHEGWISLYIYRQNIKFVDRGNDSVLAPEAQASTGVQIPEPM